MTTLSNNKTNEHITIFATILKFGVGISHMRVLQPMAFLVKMRGVDVYVSDDANIVPDRSDLGSWEIGPRVIILHRPILAGPEGLARLRALLARGFVIISEYDDHPEDISSAPTVLSEYEGRPPYLPSVSSIRPEDLLTFTGVHAVQTSTEALARVLRPRNPEVAVFPNAIDQAPRVRNFANPDRLTLFFGSLNRDQDWREVMPALNAVLKAAGDRLFVRVIADKEFFDALLTPYKHFIPFCNYEYYLDFLSQSDIALMPRRDTPVNRCKSDAKFLEASAARVLSLASPVVYGDSIDHGRTGLIFRTPQDFTSHLCAILGNPNAARSMANAARSHVLATHMLNSQIQPRLDWYREL